MEWLSRFIQRLADLLGDLGVPEASRTLGALGLVYVLVTLLIFLAIFALFRRLRRRRSEPPPLEPSEEVTPEAPVTPPPPPAAAREGEESAPARTPAEAVPPAVIAPPLNLLERMRAGLAKTQTSLVGRIDALLGAGKKVDADLLEEIEEILITADLGMKTTRELMGSLEKRFDGTDGATPEALRRALQEEIGARLRLEAAPIDYSAASPFVIMVVGVNGVGKTTTIGKLAHYLSSQGKKVVLGAGDTFRAAAAEQLVIWGERSGVDVIRHDEGSDPAAVAFDAARAAVARKADVLILDTAGRLHTKVNLMEELKKVRRVLDREIPGAPHETLLVLDATTGQNALVQARLFKETVAISGIALTKLDGTARGGIVVAIGCELNLPVRFVGIGEGIDDLRPFEPDLFVEALFQRD
ncbi:cell division protein FtsY [Desulfuromonas soudanensis]|uniref:Signal recognition particle receptor FtsY n=1 Tax=Desulfuromonas soudanensis TaxID=1603606 RepID=A0A0M3QGA4_9BACT|nr:signal recognition particle-docking protein FtsY [Desulfuromonas soudanensis]ALC17473.1 cell division protein FtsY [Desulfuromonas soudanensis]